MRNLSLQHSNLKVVVLQIPKMTTPNVLPSVEKALQKLVQEAKIGEKEKLQSLQRLRRYVPVDANS